jgi:integrase
MSLFRRSKIGPFWYEFQIKGVRYRASTETTDREEAKDVEAKARIKARDGKKNEEAMTLNEASEKFFQQVGIGKPSADNMEHHLSNLVRIIGGSVLLKDIDERVVSDFVQTRGSERKFRAPKDHSLDCRCTACSLAPASINRELQTLRSMMRRAQMVWKSSVASLVWKSLLLVEPDGRIRVLTEDEEEKLFNNLRPDYHPLVAFSILTGTRKGEAIRLRWDQVDRRDGVINLRRKYLKPGGKQHTIPITPLLAAVLDDLEGDHPDLVFTHVCQRSRGTMLKGKRYPFSKGGWSLQWRRALAAAGIRDFCFHDLRHTAATRLLRRLSVVKTFGTCELIG